MAGPGPTHGSFDAGTEKNSALKAYEESLDAVSVADKIATNMSSGVLEMFKQVAAFEYNYKLENGQMIAEHGDKFSSFAAYELPLQQQQMLSVEKMFANDPNVKQIHLASPDDPTQTDIVGQRRGYHYIFTRDPQDPNKINTLSLETTPKFDELLSFHPKLGLDPIISGKEGGRLLLKPFAIYDSEKIVTHEQFSQAAKEAFTSKEGQDCAKRHEYYHANRDRILLHQQETKEKFKNEILSNIDKSGDIGASIGASVANLVKDLNLQFPQGHQKAVDLYSAETGAKPSQHREVLTAFKPERIDVIGVKISEAHTASFLNAATAKGWGNMARWNYSGSSESGASFIKRLTYSENATGMQPGNQSKPSSENLIQKLTAQAGLALKSSESEAKNHSHLQESSIFKRGTSTITGSQENTNRGASKPNNDTSPQNASRRQESRSTASNSSTLDKSSFNKSVSSSEMNLRSSAAKSAENTPEKTLKTSRLLNFLKSKKDTDVPRVSDEKKKEISGPDARKAEARTRETEEKLKAKIFLNKKEDMKPSLKSEKVTAKSPTQLANNKVELKGSTKDLTMSLNYNKDEKTLKTTSPLQNLKEKVRTLIKIEAIRQTLKSLSFKSTLEKTAQILRLEKPLLKVRQAVFRFIESYKNIKANTQNKLRSYLESAKEFARASGRNIRHTLNKIVRIIPDLKTFVGNYILKIKDQKIRVLLNKVALKNVFSNLYFSHQKLLKLIKASILNAFSGESRRKIISGFSNSFFSSMFKKLRFLLFLSKGKQTKPQTIREKSGKIPTVLTSDSELDLQFFMEQQRRKKMPVWDLESASVGRSVNQ